MPDPADIPSGFYISNSLNNTVAAAPAIGFGPAGYGVVTQGTSKSTPVTVNAKWGVITLHNASLASLASVQFTCTNSAITATDVVMANCGVGGTAGGYQVHCISVGAGTSVFRVTNVSGGALGEAATINFAVIDTTAG
jgi:hypothetical protein